MSIGYNLLTGTISESASIADLQAIFLDGNMISGSIPESIFSASMLGFFHVRENQVSGSLSSKLWGAFGIRVFGLVEE
jgi:hypothetical protein